jgi:hypothetical protein
MADPLSDILKLADAQPVLSGGFTAGGSWGIRFPEPDKIKFFALIKGHCWLRIDEQEEPVCVEEGDVILLSAQRSFTLSGGLDVSPLDANDIFSGDRSKFAKIGEPRRLCSDRRACSAGPGKRMAFGRGSATVDSYPGGTPTGIRPPMAVASACQRAVRGTPRH